MCKYSGNFFFMSNNILRGFSLYIYNVSDPPSAIHVRILHPNRNFFPISLATSDSYAYICSAYKTIVDYPGRAAVIAQH